MNPQVVRGALVCALVFFAAVAVSQAVIGGGAGFSEAEEQTIEALRPRLGEMVLAESVVEQETGPASDCLEENPGTVLRVQAERDGAGVEVVGALTLDDAGLEVRADTAFCAEDWSYVASAVTLPSNKEDYLDRIRVSSELSPGTNEQAHDMAEEFASEGELVLIAGSQEWFSMDGIGQHGWALKFRGHFEDEEQLFDYYKMYFLTNLVTTAIVVRLPEGPANDETALGLARQIEQQVTEALAAAATTGP